jgi:hypothetical protein
MNPGTKTGRSAWVHIPVGQQAGGAWVDDVLRKRTGETGLVGKGEVGGELPRQRIEVIRASDPEAAVNELFYRRGWTDGMPIVMPTIARVRDMLRFSPESAGAVIGELDPLRGEASVEKIAANAVMAGCRPEYFPVVLAAVRGIADPTFNLRGVQMTDENVTPLLIISGPLARELGINAGIGALGPGWQANATIGRALRLVMNNIGGGWPGITSLAGIGQPGRYTLCVAEHEQASPWPALHTESGLASEDSAITLLRAECSINVTGELDDVASVMASAVSVFSIMHGGCVCVLLAPATAAKLSGMRWSKRDIANHLFERGRIPFDVWNTLWVRKQIAPNYGLPRWVQAAQERGLPIPVVAQAEDIVIFVAGGDAPIPQHVYFPTWGFPICRLVVPITLPRNWDVLRRDG